MLDFWQGSEYVSDAVVSNLRFAILIFKSAKEILLPPINFRPEFKVFGKPKKDPTVSCIQVYNEKQSSLIILQNIATHYYLYFLTHNNILNS